MKKPLQRIHDLIPSLPKKDAKLAEDYLSKRDFQSILEIVESDIYKAKRAKYRGGIEEEIPDDYIVALTELRAELLNYMSYLFIPEDSDYDY